MHDFDEATLVRLLSKASHWRDGDPATNPFIPGKQQVAFLKRYLPRIGVTTIVEEPDYVDRDFLEDFAAYHVRSFTQYRSRCTRLHFFAGGATEEGIRAAMLDAAAAEPLREGYRGFVVVRPLPDTIIGRTCLATYPQKAGVERVYPTLYTQEVNLFGIDLAVETVAFQEQDRDVAACATSALWSVLQKTGRQFQHLIPSPVAITGTAAAGCGYDDRMLPAIAGLTIRQIADTIRYVGLEPLLIPLEVHAEVTAQQREAGAGGRARGAPGANGDLVALSRMRLMMATAAYLSAGLPCVLLVRITQTCAGEPDEIANHAVALTGYRIGAGDAKGYGESGARFRATRIDRLFVHDDHLGPFASMDLKPDGTLEISWPNGEGTVPLKARSHTLVVPLAHKIRIPFSTVFELALAIAGVPIGHKRTFPSYTKRGGLEFEWEIELSSLKKLRADITASGLADARRLSLLARPMPRYVWRIAAGSGERRLIEILLDATDLVQGEMLIDVLALDDDATLQLGAMFAQTDRSFDETPAHRRIREALARHAPVAPAET